MSHSNNKLVDYLKLVKFSHTIFAMPFAITGLFLAFHQGYSFSWLTLILVIACMVFARTAAMAFNRYSDREIDQKNPRTAIREIPAGIIKPGSALKFVIINALCFVVAAGLINDLTLILSPVALIVILGYSITKRYTSLCHFVLGLGLSLSPIGAYLSVTGKFALLPVMFSFIVLFWVSGFDILYALQDEHFDKTENLQSVPAALGTVKAMWISAIVHFACAALVVITGLVWKFSWPFWIGACIFIGLLVFQHIILKPNDLSKMNKAFFTSNSLAGLILASFTILSLIL